MPSVLLGNIAYGTMIDFTVRNGLGLGGIINTRQECLWISMVGVACETGQSVSVVRTRKTCLWSCYK